MMLFEPKGIVELAVGVSERCQSQNDNTSIRGYANKKRVLFSARPRPAVGPTHLPIQLVPGLLPGVGEGEYSG
jgi:hypothetical protein